MKKYMFCAAGYGVLQLVNNEALSYLVLAIVMVVLIGKLVSAIAKEDGNARY